MVVPLRFITKFGLTSRKSWYYLYIRVKSQKRIFIHPFIKIPVIKEERNGLQRKDFEIFEKLKVGKPFHFGYRLPVESNNLNGLVAY